MATFEDIIQEVMLNLEGFNSDTDLYGTVQASITDTDTTFTVDASIFPDGSGFTAGIIEIGEELVYAQSFDRSTGVFTGVLRGWRGTTAASHPAGTLVRNNPRYSRTAVKRAINDSIGNLHPVVPAIKATEFTAVGAQVRYDLPADARNIVAISYQEPGASKSWQPIRRWSFNRQGTSVSNTGVSVDIFDALAGRLVQVIYQAEATKLESLGDEFSTTTGLYDWTRDLVVYGACYRLASFVDSGRIQATTVEQAAMNSGANYGNASLSAGQNLSKYFYGLYNARLRECQERFQEMHPAVTHYTR